MTDSKAITHSHCHCHSVASFKQGQDSGERRGWQPAAQLERKKLETESCFHLFVFVGRWGGRGQGMEPKDVASMSDPQTRNESLCLRTTNPLCGVHVPPSGD